jgi:drug/metabolite transporter (DMT)-like permease
MASINQKMSLVDIMTLLGTAFCFGASYFFIEILIRHLPPLTIVTIRVILASLVLWGVVFFLKLKRPSSFNQWRSLFIIAFMNNAVPFTLFVWAQRHIDSSMAAVLNATMPFFTVILAAVFLSDEKINGFKLLGVPVGILGTAILIGPNLQASSTLSVLGQLAALLATFLYAVSSVYARRFKEWGLSPIMIAAGQVTMAALMLLPLTLIIEQPWTLPMPPMETIYALMGITLLSTVLSYILYFKLIASAGATNASLVTFLNPVTAIILGTLLLGEIITPTQTLGIAIIMLGLVIIDGRLLQKKTDSS